MAISKQQPMRPALNDVIENADDLSDSISYETAQRQSADANLQEQIGDLSGVISESIEDEAEARRNADDALQENIDSINAKYRIGKTSITVPENDTATESVIYSPAFADEATIILIWQINTVNADLTVAVSQTSTGFDISAVNASATDSITFVLSYLAIGVI